MMNKALSYYDYIYNTGDVLPQRLVDKLSPEFLLAFQNGKEAIFAPFRETQPIFYDAITSSVHNTILVESRFMGDSIIYLSNDHDGEKHLYFYMYNTHSFEYLNKKDTRCLPEDLCCYYAYTDSFSVCDAQDEPPLHPIGTPKRLSSWETLEEFGGRHKIKRSIINSVVDLFDKSDLRIWMEQNNGNIYFVDYGRADKRIFLSNKKNIQDFQEIMDPGPYFDKLLADEISHAI